MFRAAALFEPAHRPLLPIFAGLFLLAGCDDRGQRHSADLPSQDAGARAEAERRESEAIEGIEQRIRADAEKRRADAAEAELAKLKTDAKALDAQLLAQRNELLTNLLAERAAEDGEREGAGERRPAPAATASTGTTRSASRASGSGGRPASGSEAVAKARTQAATPQPRASASPIARPASTSAASTPQPGATSRNIRLVDPRDFDPRPRATQTNGGSDR